MRLLSLHCFSRSLFSLAHARKSRVQFNYYQSQLRIQVERSFGFLVRRFGIFWRSNSALLDRVALTVAVAAKVHNVAVDASDWASDEAYGEGDGSSVGGAGYLTTRTVGTSSSAAPKSGEEARDKVKNGISDAGLKRSAASRARRWKEAASRRAAPAPYTIGRSRVQYIYHTPTNLRAGVGCLNVK